MSWKANAGYDIQNRTHEDMVDAGRLRSRKIDPLVTKHVYPC